MEIGCCDPGLKICEWTGVFVKGRLRGSSGWPTSWGYVLVAMLVFLIVVTSGASAWATDIDDPDSFVPTPDVDRPKSIGIGDVGVWVYRLQSGLEEAGFRPGATDGRFGAATRGAVYAFQKYHDLERDGIFSADLWNLLAEEVSLPPSMDDPDRVEVDLVKQLLFLVVDDEVQAIVPVSSGSGGTYNGKAGTALRASTPEGSFRIGRRIGGWRESYLGWLYYPFYFSGGYAIHGSPSVPPHPASHGCVRVEIHDMDYLRGELAIGLPVYIYGKRLDREDLLPTPPPIPKQVRMQPGESSIANPEPFIT